MSNFLKKKRKNIMKFHITITNNETNEIIADHDTDAIVGAFRRDDGIQGVAAVCCNPLELASTVETVRDVLGGIEERDPELKQLTKIVRMIGDLEQELREKASETKE
jgi:predicted transcriptional regulator